MDGEETRRSGRLAAACGPAVGFTAEIVVVATSSSFEECGLHMCGEAGFVF
jgi:hypothetical protein